MGGKETGTGETPVPPRGRRGGETGTGETPVPPNLCHWRLARQCLHHRFTTCIHRRTNKIADVFPHRRAPEPSPSRAAMTEGVAPGMFRDQRGRCATTRTRPPHHTHRPTVDFSTQP